LHDPFTLDRAYPHNSTSNKMRGEPHDYIPKWNGWRRMPTKHIIIGITGLIALTFVIALPIVFDPKVYPGK